MRQTYIALMLVAATISCNVNQARGPNYNKVWQGHVPSIPKTYSVLFIEDYKGYKPVMCRVEIGKPKGTRLERWQGPTVVAKDRDCNGTIDDLTCPPGFPKQFCDKTKLKSLLKVGRRIIRVGDGVKIR